MELRSYLAGGGERALAMAYEIGREAVENGVGLLDLIALFRETVQAIMIEQPVDVPTGWILDTSVDFLGETLGAYEMTQRGYRQANEGLRRLNETLESQIKERTADLSRTNVELCGEIEERKGTEKRMSGVLDETVEAIARITEMWDPFTTGHEARVADLSCAIAARLRFGPERIKGVRVAAFLHDVGKVAIPGEILSKPGKLSCHEWGLLKEHPATGFEILKHIEFPWPIAVVVHQHQERLDGSGYPKGLKGNEILLETKVIMVADVVEAMSSHRPYRPAHPLRTALSEISEQKGVLYEQAVVDACLALFQAGDFTLEGAA